VRSDVAVKVFGDDTKIMLAYAEKIATLMRKVPGAADVKVEQVFGLPVLNIQIQREVPSPMKSTWRGSGWRRSCRWPWRSSERRAAVFPGT